MENVYNNDWNNFIISNLPYDEIKPKTIKWLNVILKPIVRLHIEFLAFRNQALYKVNHNSQICFLQAVLNDSFDNIQRRIIIRNAILREPLWFYEPEENKPVVFYEPEDNKPVYFREETEFIGDGADFTVIVPDDIVPIDTQDFDIFIAKMKGLIQYYKLFVKNGIIKNQSGLLLGEI
jgi:hypothetical protein